MEVRTRAAPIAVKIVNSSDPIKMPKNKNPKSINIENSNSSK